MRNPLTVHDPDPLDLHFLHEIVPFSCFPAVVLSPHGLPVQHHSLPPLQRPFMQLTGFPTSCIWYMSICNRREERPLCCAKPHIHTNIFKMCHVLKHLYALTSRELTGSLRKKRPKKTGGRTTPTSAFKPRSPGFAFSTLCHHLPSPDWWEEGFFGPLCCCLHRNTVFLLTVGKLLYAQHSRRDK